MRNSKRPFILFEVLLALFLVVLCAAPLVKQPIRFYRSEVEMLEALELERIADWTFTEVKELLFKQAIAWEKLPCVGKRVDGFSLPSAWFELPPSPPKRVDRTFHLFCKAEKQGRQQEIYRSLWIEVELKKARKSHLFSYRLAIQRIPFQKAQERVL